MEREVEAAFFSLTDNMIVILVLLWRKKNIYNNKNIP